MKKNINQLQIWSRLGRFLVFGFLLLLGCEDVLDKSPLDSLSDDTFWTKESDAMMALTGCYKVDNNMWGESDWWSYRSLLWLEFATDNAYDRRGNNSNQSKLANETLESTNAVVKNLWTASYKKITRCNNFLEKITDVPFEEEAKKNEMIAEIRFIRACQYFYMSQYWGDVPLVEKVLTIEEANSVELTPKAQVVSFVLKELSEAAVDLPITRPDSERGRAVRAAALAFEGRLLMAEERWGDAADVFKEIIDQEVWVIDDRYEELFTEAGDGSKEVIFAIQHLENDDNSGHAILRHLSPYLASGWHIFCPLNSIVQAYPCTDGLSISESTLYDPENPFEKRDPRLAMSVLLPRYSTYTGKLYDPFDQKSEDKMPSRSKTGYGIRKWLDETYQGDVASYGGDLSVIRYAEVLLSYLESKLETGDELTQDLLDQTINKVRARAAVNLPIITELDPTRLRDLVRNERRVELAFEGIRYWDILRWRIGEEVLVGPVYGAKLPPELIDKGWETDEQGHYYVATRSFSQKNYHWPIPQTEQDINPNLIK